MKRCPFLLSLIALPLLIGACAAKNDEPVSKEQGRFNTLFLLSGLVTQFSPCTPHSFVNGQTVTDASGDPKIAAFVTPPSSFTFDDVTSVRATSGGGFFIVDITLASIPTNLTINKSSLSGQSGIEYQWYSFFTKGSTTYSIGQAHYLSGSQQTVTFGTSDLIGVYQGTTSLGNCVYPVISGNTMSYQCNLAGIPALSNIDSTYVWYVYTINRTTQGNVQDCS